MGQFRYVVVMVCVFASVILSTQAAPTDFQGPPRSLEDDLNVNQLVDDPVTVNPLVEEHLSTGIEDKDFHGGEDVKTVERYYRVYSDGTIEFKTALSNGHIQFQRITNKVVNKAVIQVYRGYYSQRYADGRYGTTYYIADENGYRQTRFEIEGHPPILPYGGELEPISPRNNEKDLEIETNADGRSITTESSLEASSSNVGLSTGLNTETSTGLPRSEIETGPNTEFPTIEIDAGTSTELPVVKVDTEVSPMLTVSEIETGISTELPISKVDTEAGTELPVTEIDTEVTTELPVVKVDTEVSPVLPVSEIETGISTELPIIKVDTEAGTEMPVAEIHTEVTTELPIVTDVSTELPIANIDTKVNTELPVAEVDTGINTEVPVVLVHSEKTTELPLTGLNVESSTELPIVEFDTESSSVMPTADIQMDISTATNDNISSIDATTVLPTIDDSSVRSSVETELARGDKDQVMTDLPTININKKLESATDLPNLEAEITTEEEIDAVTIYPSDSSSANIDNKILETSTVLSSIDDISLSATEVTSYDGEIKSSISDPTPAVSIVDASILPVRNDNSTKPIEAPAVSETISGSIIVQPELPITEGANTRTKAVTDQSEEEHTTEGESTASVHQF